MSLANHTEIINHLISKYSLKSYIEIGVQSGVNYHAINLPKENKFGVDPDPLSAADVHITSDEFFERNTTWIPDICFIDGEHTKEQVKKDFENALKILAPYPSFIVLHDTVPTKEEITTVPRQTKEWTGSVYQFACTLCKYDFIEFKTFPVDYGVTVIFRSRNKNYNKLIQEPITWEYFNEFKEELLRFNNKLP